MIKKSLIFAAGFLIPFAVGEVVLQWIDPYHFTEKEDHKQYEVKLFDPVTHRLRKNAEARYLGTKTVISSQGWRSPEFAVPKPKGVFRVLSLGGSVPFGWGVGQGEAFPRVLERRLNAAMKLAGAKRIEVINAGVPGWRIRESGLFLKDEGVALKPDLVLLTLVATDVRTPRKKSRPELFDDDIRRFRLAWAFENRYRFNTPGTQGRRYDAYANLSEEGLAEVSFVLGLYRDVCAGSGAKFVVFDTLGREATKKRCAELGVHRIEGYTSWDLRTSWEIAPTDPHPNAEGHRYLADLIFRGLQHPPLWTK